MTDENNEYTIEFEENIFKVTISPGGCCIDQNMEINKCLELADKALYRSKTGGRNKVEMHENRRCL